MTQNNALENDTAFIFSEAVIPAVIEELSRATAYIRIAIFQLHHAAIFDALHRKLKEGVRVEVFTLPYDSINADVQAAVVERFESLKAGGALLHFCRWNIGNPERTSTATGRWYSYHGKFIVTDQSAISLSANFIMNNELDAALIYRGNQPKIDEYNAKFDLLLHWFVYDMSASEKALRNLVAQSGYPAPERLFVLPSSVRNEAHRDYWMQDYPAALCPTDTAIHDSLYICPFDIRGRVIVEQIIGQAAEYLYISTESFTDEDIMDALIAKKMNSAVDICIMTGAQSMDFSDRVNAMLRQLLASGIRVKTSAHDLHAKLLITERMLAVSSINLNKINLGFARNAGLWRGNTETISICTEGRTIADAKAEFAAVFDGSIDVRQVLAKKIEGQVRVILQRHFGLRSKQDVKTIFARYILASEIDVKRTALKIGSISRRLAQSKGTSMVDKVTLLQAFILYFLSEQKSDLEQIGAKLNSVEAGCDVRGLLSGLLESGFVECVDNYYKLRIESLF